MPQTSTCPKCDQPITILDAPEASLVECPLCQEQFELTEALDFVAESEECDCPPELIMVERREEEDSPESAEEVLAEETPDEERPEELPEEGVSEDEVAEEEATEEPPVQVRCPCCRDSFALAEVLLAETDEPLGADAAFAILADGSVREPADSAGGMRFDFGGETGVDEDHTGFSLESVEERPAASPGAFEFAAAPSGDADQADGSEAVRTQRRRRERGGMKDMVGAIFGGAAGLLITYYFLNLFGGARFDMFNVYLPGVKHTAVHRPGWLGGPPEEEVFDSGIGDSLEAAEETPRPTPKKRKPKEDKEKQDTSPAEEPTDEPIPPEPEEETLPPDYVGLLDPPQVTPKELGQALRTIDQLAEAGPLTEEGYEQWCLAARAATFLDRKDGDPQTQERLNAMRRLLKGLSDADVTTIGEFATRRAANPDRASHGVLGAGTVRNANIKMGNAYITGVIIVGTEAKVVVASDRKLPVQAGDRILIPGYLVDKPKDAVQGLDTEQPQVTWVRTVEKLGDKAL